MSPKKVKIGTRIGVIGTQSSTINCINGLMRHGYEINLLITIPPNLKKGVADYQDLRKIASECGIPLVYVGKYSMKDSETKRLMEQIDLNAVVVVGWQRLIPKWFLDRIPYGVYGMHGSSLPLPKGRGRSPLNWSILEGKDRFYTYLFRYDPGVDSGNIIDCQRFDICSWDTIRSLQHKNTVSQYKLLVKNFSDILTGRAKASSQDETLMPSYYPKRAPEDGVIDWSQWTARDIFGLVRAVTKPYPGATTEYEGEWLYIWDSAPFDSCIQYPEAESGEIVEVFTDGTFVVKCFVDSLLVISYEASGDWNPCLGHRFTSHQNNSHVKLAEMKIQEFEGEAVGGR